MKICWHHTNNGGRAAIEINRLVHDPRISAETSLPDLIAEQHYVTTAFLIFVRQKIATALRLNAKRGKHVRGYQRSGKTLRRVESGEIESSGGVSGDLGKCLGLLTKDFELGYRNFDLFETSFVQISPDRHQLVGVTVRQWAQHDCVNDTEDGAVGPDA